MKLNKIIKLFFFILILNFNTASFSSSVKIILKVDNEIITNADIKNEIKYLVALNNDLNKLSNSDLFGVAKNSIIKEKIKEKEIKRYLNIENYSDEKLIENIIQNFQKKLNLTSREEFLKYLNDYDVSLQEMINKIKIEILWNQLIVNFYENQVIIDENKIKKKIIENKLNLKKVIEYDLSEILFQLDASKNFDEFQKEIYDSIKNFGFSVAANKYSISDSNKFGGKIGLINENQLSKVINDNLKKINVGEFTKTIKIANGYLILKINDKKELNQELDQDKILSRLIEFERNKQYDQFSKIYFNKIKMNSKIYE